MVFNSRAVLWILCGFYCERWRMSKEKPEVGDVWKFGTHKYHVLESGKYNDVFDGITDGIMCICDDFKKFQGFKTRPFLKGAVYLGKSKANINDLFEVENDQ